MVSLHDHQGFEAEKALLAEIEGFNFNGSRAEYFDANMPKTFVTRDSEAMAQGIRLPAHVFYQGVAHECRTRCAAASEFLDKARVLARRLQNREAKAATPATGGSDQVRPITGRVFIGHGRSPIWRELKDFLHDRLSLDWDEFNRDSPAGLSTKERLEEMLGRAGFAFLVMTADDAHHDGTRHARENVIHEAGLFQGKLGFRRAIVVLEEGCAEFSNIHGLGQLRFPAGRISAVFEEVRQVLKREDVLIDKQ
jgi:predicted nucleotide-binding protein